ncbi:MAG: histidine phosphatase family protein [Bifidobacteriaceae bacterium]|nr:histidine phosphatase family protein [Bifidobacteriaceae bacterium]
MIDTLFLIRHGQTDWNITGRIQGNPPLNKVGVWQAEQSAKALEERYKPDSRSLVVCSGMTRACQTAHIFADPLGLKVEKDPRLIERKFGQWEGELVSDLLKKFPEDLEGWRRGEGNELKYGVEPHEEVAKRTGEAIMEWTETEGGWNKLFVFSHGTCINDCIRFIFSEGGNLSFSKGASLLDMNNAFWARFERRGRRWAMASFNEGPNIAYKCDWNAGGENGQKE